MGWDHIVDGNPWTDDRIKQLEKLWKDGLSCSQIAAQMGAGLTRAAVIGKIHRLGLTSKDGGSEYRHPTGLRTRSAASIAEKAYRNRSNGRAVQAVNSINRVASKPKPQPGGLRNPTRIIAKINGIDPGLKEFAPASNDDQQIPVEQRKTIFDLKNNTCRWPVGEPGKPGFFFCGSPRADLEARQPYCPIHARRAGSAYVPARLR